MRFGLSDLEELPSLKEFEALAREALGSDEGFAPAENGSTNEASIGPATEEVASDERRVASRVTTEKTASAGPMNEAAAGEKNANAEMEAREEMLEETAANNEGMPEAENTETPKAAAARE